MSTAGRRSAAAALVVAVIASALPAGDTVRAAAAGTPVPDERHRVILGAVGNSRAETIARERETGRRIQGIRAFKRWNEPLIGADQRWARRTRHTVFLSVKSRLRDGSLLRWRDIADAAPGSPLDADLRRQARELKSFGDTIYLVFNHEPDAKTSRPMGEPADFVAAWRRVVATHREAGVTNARYVWTMTDQAFQQRYAGRYYPGDRYVDGIAVDAYNWYDCRGGRGRWTSLADLIEPHRRFGLEHPGKDLMVLEWGSVEDHARPGRKAEWIRDAAALFDRPAYRAYRAVAHWDDRHTGPPSGQPCRFDYRTSPSAMLAWRAMAAHPAFQAGAPRPAARRRPVAMGLTVLIGSGMAAGLLLARLRAKRRHKAAGSPPPRPNHR
ncbi:hypothetical protein [Actinomadura alba]|uniref:GH26 domain-containing protein n=1 Tax=Actinomadura alba TaxID=406431 RepID=A0ABR7LQS6_9ACTN|nr:hypothetical protein [Actinomadura alba]MBC6467192.1 hypothetical protein [Actinomadura alba]